MSPATCSCTTKRATPGPWSRRMCSCWSGHRCASGIRTSCGRSPVHGFTLVGAPDEGNPTSVSPQQVRSWAEAGLVEWWGHREDVADVLARSHVAVLPSYGEGMPKTLLEAAACGRPVVATDVSGCWRWCAMESTVCWCTPGTPARWRMRSRCLPATRSAAPRWGPRAGGGRRRSSPPSTSTRKHSRSTSGRSRS